MFIIGPGLELPENIYRKRQETMVCYDLYNYDNYGSKICQALNFFPTISGEVTVPLSTIFFETFQNKNEHSPLEMDHSIY